MTHHDRLSATPVDASIGTSNARHTTPTAGDIVRAITGLISHTLALIALEGRLAIVSLIAMLAAGIVAATALVAVWLFLLGAVAAQLVAAGWSWPSVLLTFAGANAILALFCGLVVRWLSRHLLFSETRRALRPRQTNLSDDPKVDTTQE